ncbi:MAG: hypothetical protein Q9208_000515 [Pyrenodesmia sp. 3 TL-2023]
MPSPTISTIPPELRLQIYDLLLTDPIHPSSRTNHFSFSWPCPHLSTDLPAARIPCTTADSKLYPCPHLHAARRGPASPLRLNKALNNEYATLFYRTTRWQLRIDADKGLTLIRTPNIFALRSPERGESRKWLVGENVVRDMHRWQVVICLAMKRHRGEHDAMGYLVKEYNEGSRSKRREMARESICGVREHLRRWCIRMADAGVEMQELEVRVVGADLIDLKGEREDLLAPLRELRVAKGGKVEVVVHGEGYEGVMERGDRGFRVAERNRAYAREVEKAMRGKKRGKSLGRVVEVLEFADVVVDTKDAVLRREIDMFGERIREIAALVADDGYIYRFNAGITAAQSKAQAVLRCLTLSNSNTNTNNASLPEMIKQQAASYRMVEECVRAMAEAKKEGNKRDLMREERITEEQAEKKLAAGEKYDLRKEVGKVEKIREWFFMREELRAWWPKDVFLPDPKPVEVVGEEKKQVDEEVWIDCFGSDFW